MSSSTNQLQNIAIVGASGHVGLPITKALLVAGQHRITAITRPDSTSALPEGLHAVSRTDIADTPSLVSSLTGQDALIITLSVMTPPETQSQLIDAAVAAKVKYVFLNEWGIDIDDEKLATESGAGIAGLKAREYAESKMRGTETSWIAVTCGCWYEHSLSLPLAFGFDFAERKITFVDEGDVKICASTWATVGEAVAKLLALKVAPEGAADEHTTISQFANKAVHVSSFAVSQSNMLESVLRVTGEKESDWTVVKEGREAKIQRGVEKLKAREYAAGHVLRLYSRVFFPNGGGDFSQKVINGQLGLESVTLDEATRQAVAQAKGGYRYGPGS